MSVRSEKDKTKQLQEKCQTVLNNLLKDEDNKYCVDCDSKGPRWASWNIGVFLCIRCAGIHRNLGVHISKVKSVNLDTWTPDQVVSLQQMGNSRARAVYEANLPDNFRRPQNDSSLESFIRAKYEHKKYIAHEWVPPPLPKVNWEKEIDEEMEKQRRKKKTVIEQTHLENVEVPQLPKPNPKPIPVITSDLATEKKQKKDDFLGLQNGEDSFSGFISASTSKTEEEIKTSAKNEEESFFNQIIPMEKQKTKLDKNSILALYSRNPTNNFQYSNAQPFHNPNFPYTQNNFQSATTFPPSQIVPHNNLLSTSAQWPSHTPSQWNQQNEYVNQSSHFIPNTTLPNLNQLPNNSTKFINMSQISSNQFLPKQTNPQNQVPTSFLGNHNLQQQFSSLTLKSQDINATFPSY